MARTPTTFDTFSAIAEPKRRRVIDTLAFGERGVNDLVRSLGWSQPQVSKHLGVLKKVGLVNVRREGRERLYSLNAEQLKPIHDWAQTFEHFWTQHLDRVKTRAEQLAANRKRTVN